MRFTPVGQLRALLRQGRVRLRPHRVVAGHGRDVELADGTVLPVSTALRYTGFRPDSAWIGVEGALDAGGAPLQEAGAWPVAGLH